MLLEHARQFTMREVLPLANSLDPVEGDIPLALIDQDGQHPGYSGFSSMKNTEVWAWAALNIVSLLNNSRAGG